MYKCSHCGKEYQSQAALSGHMSVHKVSSETFTCSICGKVFTKHSSFLNHERYCKFRASKPSVSNFISTYNVDKKVLCKYCGKQCKNKNSLIQHELRCNKNPEHISSIVEGFNNRGRDPWNLGLTKDRDLRVAKQAAASSKALRGRSNHPQSDETRNILSVKAKEREFGGFNMRNAAIEYNGIKLDSSYELRVAKSLEENNIKWQRCNRFKYTHSDGSVHYYTPDFYLPEYDIYLDPKNDYLIENVNQFTGMTDVEKIQRAATENNIRVLILDKECLTWDKIKELVKLTSASVPQLAVGAICNRDVEGSSPS